MVHMIMLLLLIFCLSFIIVFKSPYLSRFLIPDFWVQMYNKKGFKLGVFEIGFLKPTLKSTNASSELLKLDGVGISLLDLHDFALDLILNRLSPSELCSLAGVCSYMRSKCRSNHMWEKHMEKKWGKLIGNAALRDWHWYMASNKKKYSCLGGSGGGKNGGILNVIFTVWPFSLISRTKIHQSSEIEGDLNLPPDSIMAWYFSLENGEFWFPAQVYNRENGHDGFMLSCYDAKLSYNLKTDTFHARYSPHGRHTIEENISWSRLRTPPIDIPPYNLHVSDCLHDLRPGDHFEIQWRRNKAYPYGWWYGVISHLESCSGNDNHCICHDNEMVMMEFNQYAPESRWRRKKVSRKDHHENGNEADGFYGGIRKLYCQEEISIWKNLWPTKVLN